MCGLIVVCVCLASLCLFLLSFVLHCRKLGSSTAPPPNDVFKTMLVCAPSLSLFVVHQLLEAHSGRGTCVASKLVPSHSVSKSEQGVYLRETTTNVMRHAHSILSEMVSMSFVFIARLIFETNYVTNCVTMGRCVGVQFY